jgi:hypothetical protein
LSPFCNRQLGLQQPAKSKARSRAAWRPTAAEGLPDVVFLVVARPFPCACDLRRRGLGHNPRRLLVTFTAAPASGTRPLRLISLLGAVVVVGGFALSAYVFYRKLTAGVPVQGWTSVMVAVSISSGLILFALGIIAEYLGIAVSMAMGKPLYLIVSDPEHKDHRE